MEITRKKRILMVNDGSPLHSGYSTYGREILSRLHQTGKYEIAELACYISVEDANFKKYNPPWLVYPNAVKPDDDRFNDYKNTTENTYGLWRFDRVCIDFEPDIVFDIRDPWMFNFIFNSPARPYFHLALMPTVDSAPQQPHWLEQFSTADSILTYTDYGSNVLKENSNIKVVGEASPGVDPNVFKPLIKKSVREFFNLTEDINIIGTVMRNQRRKLYPDLFKAFRNFIDLCYKNNNSQLAKTTILHCHSSYPDAGWNIPELLKEYELSSKVVFTYVCNNINCGNVKLCTFSPNYYCEKCNQNSMLQPSTLRGVNSEELSLLYNNMDLYVQYAVCEGFGMPQAEAAACGIPIASVNYSAMEDVIKYAKGISVPAKSFYKDPGTWAWRAMPDNDKFAEELYKFLIKPKSMRKRMGRHALEASGKYWNWDKTAKVWEDHFDSIELTDLQGKWHVEPKEISQNYKNMSFSDFKDLNINDFVRSGILKILQDPSLLNSIYEHKHINSLIYQKSTSGDSFNQHVTKEMVFNEFIYRANKYCAFREALINRDKLQAQDFITFAKQRKSLV